MYLLKEAPVNSMFQCIDLPANKPGDPYVCDKTPAGDKYKVKVCKLISPERAVVKLASKADTKQNS